MRLLRRNLFWVYATYAVSIVSGLVTTPILVGGLGKAGFGVWAVIGSLTAYLALLDFGIGPAVVRFAAEQRGRRSLEETSALASVGLVVYAVIGVLTLLLGALAAWLLPHLVDLPEDLVSPAQLATLLVVAGLAARFPLGLFGNLLVAQQRNDVLNIAGSISTLLYALAVVVVFARGGGIVAVGAIALVTTVLRLLLPLAWLRRELPSLRLRPSLVTRAQLRELLAVSGDNLLIHISGRVVFTADVIVVGVALGAEQAAVYAIPAKLFALAYGLGIAGTSLLYPAFAELEGADDELRQRLYLRTGLRTGMAAMLVVALPLLLLPGEVIRAWVGGGFEGSTRVLVLLALALVIHQPITLLTQYLMARGRQRPVARIMLASVVVSLLLSIALALTVGLWGVALGTLLGELVMLALVPRLVAGVAGISLATLARSLLRPVLPALALGIPVLAVAGRALDADELLSLAPLGLVWIALAAPVLWLFGLAPAEREALARKLRPSQPPLAAVPESL